MPSAGERDTRRADDIAGIDADIRKFFDNPHFSLKTAVLSARELMKRVAFGELYLRLRNNATDQLTRNPAAERSRGSFVSANNRKGLRHVRPWPQPP